MGNVFKRLIRKEFGINKYNQYVGSYYRRMRERNYDYRNLQNEEIFEDIYESLKDKDIESLKKMFERLTEAMLLVVKISKTYLSILLVFIAACIFIITRELIPTVTISSIVLMSACFLYKTYEYVANKFCYIDARIVIVYKSVLDQLLTYKK
jgi:predicted house-cleaning noncanonical NTP pyrophosphatase (MazG superfamily)